MDLSRYFSVVCFTSLVLVLAEWEANATYDGGFTKEHPTARAFWKVVHGMSADEQKRLLLFVTGSGKAPIGGLRSLPFRLQRNGPDSDRLPTASTCFNILLLPDYSSEEKIRERLSVAINNSTGFGLQ